MKYDLDNRVSDKENGNTEVVKYDRDMLTRSEVQPVATEDGHTITVNHYGQFSAKLGEVTVTENTLQEAREKVHTNHLAQERKRKKKAVAVPCFLYNSGSLYSDTYVGLGFFRGVHSGNGKLMWSKADGSKGSSERVYIWARDHEDVPRVTELAERKVDLDEELRGIQNELHKLCSDQKDRMYGDRVGWGSRYSHRIKDNAERANEQADMLIVNVLTTAVIE